MITLEMYYQTPLFFICKLKINKEKHVSMFFSLNENIFLETKLAEVL